MIESKAVKQFNEARMDKAAKVRLCDFVPCWNKWGKVDWLQKI